MGVVADLKGHWIPGTTILSLDGKTLGSRSPVLEIPGSSSGFLDAAESVSQGADLGGLAF